MHERLYRIFSSEAFLSCERTGNEAPLYIQPYEVQREDEMSAMIRDLHARLRTSGIQVIHLDMFRLTLEILRDSGRLDRILEKEAELGPAKMLQLLQGRLDVKRELVPRMEALMAEAGTRLSLLSGFGHLYPFLRTHTILETLYTCMPAHPVVFFFPGDYSYTDRYGSRLLLFGQEGSGHYRAINLDTYAA